MPLTGVFAQIQIAVPVKEADTTWKTLYRETAEKRHDLIHTKLDVRFDFEKAYMYGKEWLTLKSHFYSTDTVILDAKGMDIKKVQLMKGTSPVSLKFEYDSLQLRVIMDRPYKRNENFTLYFEYTSKPNELKAEGSEAITDAKGLYFINPQGKEEGKETSIWTQGETESNSAWMITIDKPNQKTTEEIYMTVPDKFVTLSNGLLMNQKKNTDGTRTDYWKMDLPHAPYLFFMGAGEFAVIKDSYKGKEVSYYVEKKYAPYARGIFGLTPEMMACYSKLTGVEYAWPKYSQIVGRDYVSGAMENTTATLHQESAYQTNRELADGNDWEETIAHELFHQWFGDLVTTESWSNITLNESFANYGEYLWLEYKYGKDRADKHNYEDMQQYLMSGSDKKDLVRYHYASREDVFDPVSYPKGGRILHMLRQYVGDSAFFKSLNLYLTSNKFKSAEASQLRLAFEEVTGKDLNWYFNQWYYGSGHPNLKITYAYDDTAGKAMVIVEQAQKSGKIFTMPVAIDIVENNIKTRYERWIKNKADTFVFAYTMRPELINFDATKTLLCEKTDNKLKENYLAQWKHAGNYVDRFECINYFAKKGMAELAYGLDDKSEDIQRLTLQKLGSSSLKKDSAVIAKIETLAVRKNMNARLRAAAIGFLVKNGNAKYESMYNTYIKDSSYSVAAACLKGLLDLHPDKDMELAKQYGKNAGGALAQLCNETIMKKATEEDFDMVTSNFDQMAFGQEKIGMAGDYADYLEKVNDLNKVKKGIDVIIKMRDKIPSAYRKFIDPMMQNILEPLGKSKGDEIKQYIEKKME
jgi:aminopeptidase N